ncbi:MAG: alpha/beta hydrolase [Deltaproteobacteria bacterium]|nr:alpha/beta hydrolase [Deltaproteobacteria bacterium]
MQETSFSLPETDDGVVVQGYRWLPEPEVAAPVRATVQVAHGLAEHCARYRRMAEGLTARGFAVYASDHRGHGRTGAEGAARGFFAERDGWGRVLEDLARVGDLVAREQPGVPRVLFGHSMGSYLAQQVLFERGEEFAGAVLSGSSSGVSNPLAPIGRVVARAERWRVGPKKPSALLTKLSFGEFNKAFEPARTAYDWLSRDPAEVDRYIADPWCGFEASTQLWVDLLNALPGLALPENLARVPRAMPLYVVSGERDPIHSKLKGFRMLVDAYRDHGMLRVYDKLYQGARHELLNETHRDEVTRDLAAWIEEAVLGAR